MFYYLFRLIVLLVFIYNSCYTQNVSGTLSLLSEQSIKLEGFNGIKTYLIANTNTDDKGKFQLKYSKADYGIAYLISDDANPFLVILSGENIEIMGEALSNPESVKIRKGQENIWYEQYAHEHPKRERAFSAWDYLEKIYALDSLFSIHQMPKQDIEKEKERIKDEDAAFLNHLPKDSYVSWFLPVRKLVSSVSTVAQYRTEEIPESVAAFRKMDYTDIRLYKSGLFKDAIESHFWLLENSGRSLDSVYIEMKISIDAMMQNLIQDEKKFNEVTDYLFNLLERHSLFQASEYLALKVLNEISCTIEDDLAKQLESYRTMKIGNVAPDIHFKGDVSSPVYSTNSHLKKLSDIQSKFTLVVFAASWCPKCVQELPAITRLYTKWKSNGIEVVFVSLDDNTEIYHSFIKPFPFISTCNFQKWDSKAVKDYYVFATPTMFLLNAERGILLRPISVAQVDTWVDYNMIDDK